MARRIWTEPRTEQPTDGADLAFNPCLPRPAFAHVASVPRLDIISGKFATQTAGDAYASSQHGRVFVPARAANAGLTFPLSVRPMVSDEWTILVLANPVPGSEVGTLFSQRYGSPPYEQVDLAINVDYGYGARYGALGILAANTSGLVFGRASDSQAVVDGQWHIFAATRSGSSTFPLLYVDGQIIAATASGTPTTTVAANQITRIGNIGDYSGAEYAGIGGGGVALVVVYPTALSAETIRRLGHSLKAIWQAFAERQVRVWVPSSIARRAIVIGTSGGLRQIADSEIGTGLKPVVLMADGSVRQRAAAEGSPMVLVGGTLRTLAPGETLLQ